MQLNFNFNGKTLLRNWWGIVKENFQTIQTAFADHLNKFTEHKTSVELDHPDKSVKQKHIADYSIGTQQIEQYTVTGPKIYPAAVQTSHIKDKNVTMPKLSQDLPNIIISVQNGLVWQNDCDLIWQNAGTEIHKVTYNQSSDTGEVEVYVKPVITVTGSTGIFTIGNNGVNITVKHQGNFIIDCKKEIVYNGNTSLMKDTAGAFFELAPDTDNTITIIGTGTAQINYIPQFLYDATLDNMDWGDK